MVPEGWRAVGLGEMASVITKGTTPPKKAGNPYVDDGVPFIRVENITSNGSLDLTGCKFITEEVHESLGRSQAQPGDVLVSIAGALGRVAVVPPELIQANMNQAVSLVRLRDGAWEREYLKHALMGPAVQAQVEFVKAQLAQANLNLKQVGQLEVLLPPLPEQRKIAAILGSVDALIERTQAVIDQVEVVKKGLMQELLTRGLPGRHTRFKQTEIGEIPESWEVKQLGDVVARIDSGWSPRCEAVPAGPGEWGVLKVSAATWGRFRADENKRLPEGVEPRPAAEVHPGDLILSRANTAELVARPVFVTPAGSRLMMSDKLLRLVPGDLVEARFLKLLLESPRTRSQLEDRATGSSKSMKNISQAKLRTVAVPLPAPEEQLAIAGALESAEERLLGESRALATLGELKTALSSVLLSGEVRVQTDDSEVAA